MGSKCSESFYDALGGKHRSGELFAVISDHQGGSSRPETVVAGTYTIVSGTPANTKEIRVEDLAQLCRDERLTVTLHSHRWEGVPIPFDPENFRGRGARRMFDAEKARTALGEGYGPWLAECARNLPTAPEDSLEYSKKVAEAFTANLSGVGLVYDLTGAPGVLAAGPEALLKRFYGNFGMVDVAARILVERLTPKVTAGEAALLCEYLGSASGTERDDLCLRALERLGIWDPSTPVTIPSLAEEDDADASEEPFDIDPPSALTDAIRARALLLELELGVPGLAAMLGCSAKPDDDNEGTYRLNIYDLAEAAGKRHPSFVAAKAYIDQRAAAVALSVARRHKLVSYAIQTDLPTWQALTQSPGQPIVINGKPLGAMLLVGVTADGEVLAFRDVDFTREMLDGYVSTDDHQEVRRFSDDESGLISRHPSVDDALRGTRGTIFDLYFEELRDSMLEQGVEQSYGEPVGEPVEAEDDVPRWNEEEEREDRARVLAQMAIRDPFAAVPAANAGNGQHNDLEASSSASETPAENPSTENVVAEYHRRVLDVEYDPASPERHLTATGVLFHHAMRLLEDRNASRDTLKRLLEFMAAHPEKFPAYVFEYVARHPSCPSPDVVLAIAASAKGRYGNLGPIAAALTVLAEREDVTTEQRARIDTLAGKAERKQRREDKARTGPPIADLRSMDLRGCDLSDRELAGLDLSGLDMAGANLSGADLTGVNFAGTDLSNADLSGAELTGVNFAGTDLSNADLSGADLRGVDLGGVLRGSGINFSGANLSGVNFSPKNRDDSDASDLLDDFRAFIDDVDPDDFRDT